MNDVLPDEAAAVGALRGHGARRCSRSYGYRNLRVPIVEPTPLFVRGIGEVDRHRREGDVHLRRHAERRQPDAAPRGDRRHRARGDRAQPRSTNGRCACGPPARCSATSGRRRAATASSTSSTSRRSALPGPDVDAEQIVMLARLWRALGLDGRSGSRSTRSATPASARAHRARADRVLRAARATRSTTTRGAGCTQSAAHPRQQEPGDAGR